MFPRGLAKSAGQSRTPCSDIDDRIFDLLRDVAKMQMGQGLDYDSAFMERVRDKAEQRSIKAKQVMSKLTDELQKLKSKSETNLSENPTRGEVYNDSSEVSLLGEISDLEDTIRELERDTQSVSRRDYDDTLRELEERGLISQADKKYRLTSIGAKLLGQGLLSRILLILEKSGRGTHLIEDYGQGTWASLTSRPFELGDAYHQIDVDRTLLSPLERGDNLTNLSQRDFWVRQPLYSTELHMGVLVDQSASMRAEGKVESAVEMALAISELMRKSHPEDKLTLFAFSEEVKEVEPWKLTALTVPMGFTDIRAALRFFRRRVAYEPGNKQAHLITDSAPNFLDGEFVGFTKATETVIAEARLLKLNGIVLNVVMLDDDPQLRQMAKRVAKENLGRVAYVDPRKLGEVVVEDYLSLKSSLMG